MLIVIQEMNARMGIVTGKGLADLIRENAGVKVTFFIFVGLLIADIGNTTTEFAGVAGSMEVFSVSKYISVPIVGFVVWIMVVKGNYKIAERIFLNFQRCIAYVCSFSINGQTALERNWRFYDPSENATQYRKPCYGNWYYWYNHCPLDAILYAIVGN